MNIKIGDKVRFLNEKGEGIVSKIINQTTLGITIEDGFELPFAVSQLLFMHNESQPLSSVKNSNGVVEDFTTKKNSITSTEREQKGIYIAFSPEKENDITHSDIHVWMINHTNYQILFSYSIAGHIGSKTIETGRLDAFEHTLIETIDKKLVTENSNFIIDVLFFDEKEHKHQLPISEIIKLKPIRLYKENSFSKNNFISAKALIMDVFRFMENKNEEPILTKKELSKMLLQKKNHSEIQKTSKPHIHNNPAYEMEIDLHIEELMDNYSGMGNAEIIQIQLKHFQKALDKAITEHYRKLIIIHGVGNGRLKSEIRSILSSYTNLRIHDGSYSKYGFGATEVVIG